MRLVAITQCLIVDLDRIVAIRDYGCVNGKLRVSINLTHGVTVDAEISYSRLLYLIEIEGLPKDG